MLEAIRRDAESSAETGGRSYEQIAAVDLGSNSFRLQIGRVLDDQIYPLDSIKESVRLASGLAPDKLLDEASQQRALEVLRQFGERLRGFSPEAVRAVATNTLRVAKNAAKFLALAEQALGFSIEIIAGREEARLIYIGAIHSLPAADHQRLVVDIGGGSTEFIIGRKSEPQLMESLYMGCVSYSLRFFPDGKVSKRSFRNAEVAAAKEIEAIAGNYRDSGWHEAIGSSGTARAIADLIELNHLNPGGIGGITRQGLATLRALMIRAGSADAMALDGLPKDRLPVLAGGIAIMCAVFSELRIEHMGYADGALRLGVLYDLLGRFHHRDMRDSTVVLFMGRHELDEMQAERVCNTALTLIGQLVDSDEPGRQDDLRLLKWAANLHEIGISIAHNNYHKHGAYILSFADMPGFSKKDQERLSLLVLGQRGKLEKMPAVPRSDAAWHLIFCLRLAVALHRSRDDHTLVDYRVRCGAGGYELELPDYWLAQNPLSASVLDDETAAWQRIGSDLRISGRASPTAIAA